MKFYRLATRLLPFSAIISAVVPISVLAQGFTPIQNAKRLFGILEDSANVAEKLSPEQIVANLIETTLGVVGIILIVLIIYGGYLWGTARGNEERVTQAQNLIRNAVIGVIIIFSAYFITAFVVGKIGEATFEPLFPF